MIMFSKAKRFDPLAKKQTKEHKCQINSSNTEKPIQVSKCKPGATSTSIPNKPKKLGSSGTKSNYDTQSQCSSIPSNKAFATPKPVKNTLTSAPSSLKKNVSSYPKKTEKNLTSSDRKVADDIIKAQEAEIRNKDYTIAEYNRQIEELKTQIATLQTTQETLKSDNDIHEIHKQVSRLSLDSGNNHMQHSDTVKNELIQKIMLLEQQCEKLEQEVSNKQVELSSFEAVICIRDSLCKDLQDKLTSTEACLEETRQRLEMVKGHHALALEANESIRREYKVELESMKTKLEDEKQSILNKCKADQDAIKTKYILIMENLKEQLNKEKSLAIHELKQQLTEKDSEMKAKLEQIDEATREKLRLCEIQFEERCRSIQEHWSLQEERINTLKKETNDLKYTLKLAEEQKLVLEKEINILKNKNNFLETENTSLCKEVQNLKDESKIKFIDFENQINKLTVDVDKAVKDKNKFEMSLSVTRDIVEVLTMRLRESDDEVEHLEGKIATLNETKEKLEQELVSHKNSLNNTVLECNEYKDALVNILKSKAALAKEHTRIMEHNVSLIESLQNVEKEAYRELGTIKNELIEDVELLKKESKTQIKLLRDEVEKKRVLCELATEHAGQATVAAEQSRLLLSQAASEITRLETENQRLTHQIQDQQSLVVELSLLRQENEELAMTIAKQSSIIDKMKKDMEHAQSKPKSPSVLRKSHKLGKENSQIIISPLRERNH